VLYFINNEPKTKNKKKQHLLITRRNNDAYS